MYGVGPDPGPCLTDRLESDIVTYHHGELELLPGRGDKGKGLDVLLVAGG